MGLKKGLYVMLFANREENYDDDFSNDSRWLGAVWVGEIPAQFRQSYLKALRKRFDMRYSEEYQSFGIDFHYHDVSDNDAQNDSGLNEDDSNYPRQPTETELMDMILNSEMMSADHQEALDFAVGIAKEMDAAMAAFGKQNPTTTNIADNLRMFTQAATGMGEVTIPAKVMAATLRKRWKKACLNKIIRSLFDQRPETKTFTSTRLLQCLQDISQKKDIITITPSRIRQLDAWKENRAHRESGKAQNWEDMSDVRDENAKDVNSVGYDVAED